MDPCPGPDPPPLRAHLLGPVRLALGDRPVADDAWPRRSARSLLLLLLATPGHRLPRERALDLLWPEAAPDAARNALSVALHGLRRALEPELRAGRASAYVEAGGEELRLRPHAGCWIDADAFEAALVAAGSAAPSDRVEFLRQAIALYGGDLLADELSADWPVARRESLRASWRRAVLDLAEIEQEAGRSLAALPPLERVLTADPTDEAALRALMRALAAAGRPEEALRHFERCAEALRDSFAVEPAAETRALAATLRTQPAPSLAAAPATPRFDNLPAPPNPLVGRDRELEALQDLLWDPTVRLVTVTGAGGIGKTRLALEAARRTADDFTGGACWVPLAPLRDPELVLPTLARTLGLDEAPGQPVRDTLAASLRARELLVVLDNAEHMLAIGPDLAELLAACPKLTLLVTSRRPLRLRAEHELPTPPLAVPPLAADSDRHTAGGAGRYEAVVLFVQRARAVNPRFALTDDNAPAVAALAARLDGLPLAIELAAARGRRLAPDDLLAALGDRFALLADGYHDLPDRQRTMRDAIAWSHDLLDPAERALFRRLAVFVGGFSAEAAEFVGGAEGVPLRSGGAAALRGTARPNPSPPRPPERSGTPSVRDLLASLADQNLIGPAASAGGTAGPRFAMLETVREYALEALTAAGETAAAQRAHAAVFLTLAERTEAELVKAHDAAWLDRLELEHDNLRAAFDWALGAEPATALRLARLLARFWSIRGHLREGHDRMERALAASPAAADGGASDDRAGVANAAGWMAEALGRFDRAQALYEEALGIWRGQGDRAGMAKALDYLGNLAQLRGDVARSVALHEEALASARTTGNAKLINTVLVNLAESVVARGDLAEATRLYEETLDYWRTRDDPYMISVILNNLGSVALRRGDPARAVAHHEESLRLKRELGHPPGIALTLANLGAALLAAGEVGQGTTLIDEALDRYRELGDPHSAALARLDLGRAAERRGDDGQAATQLTEALAAFHRLGDRSSIAGCVEGLARICVRRGASDLAARLSGAAGALWDATGARREPQDAPLHERAMAAARAAIGDAAFGAACAAGAALPLDEAVAEAAAATAPPAAPSPLAASVGLARVGASGP